MRGRRTRHASRGIRIGPLHQAAALAIVVILGAGGSAAVSASGFGAGAVSAGAVSAGAGSQSPSGGPVPQVIREKNISPHNADLAFPLDDAFDPIVATDPTDPQRIAVSYQGYRFNSGSCSTLVSGLRISDDGGQHWHEAKGMPWQGTGRAPNWHSAIAWGPGPVPGGPDRLYWVDTTVPGCDYDHHRLSVAYSDDEGATWSKMFTERATPPTLGGYPDITVDTDPGSPNYGVVYAVYNWFPNAATEPGMRLLASSDFGVTWHGVEIPPVGGLSKYPFKYRISYRVRTAPDGGVYVAFSQSDTTNQYETRFGRLGFGLTRALFNRATGTFQVRKPRIVRTVQLNAFTVAGAAAPGSTDFERLATRWTYGLDVDPVTGSVYLALPDYVVNGKHGVPRGRVNIGRSNDNGITWSWTRLPHLPTVGGLPQSANKPTLAVRNNVVFVGVHGLVDVPYGTHPSLGEATIGNYYAVSYDGGTTFTRPAAISDSRWNLEALANTRNRAGLRDRAAFTADGRIYYVYGDGRMAQPKPDPEEGRSQIFGVMISLGT